MKLDHPNPSFRALHFKWNIIGGSNKVGEKQNEQIFSDISAIILLVFANLLLFMGEQSFEKREIFFRRSKALKHLLNNGNTCWLGLNLFKGSSQHRDSWEIERKATTSGDRIPYKLNKTKRKQHKRKRMMKNLSICMIITNFFMMWLSFDSSNCYSVRLWVTSQMRNLL